MRLEIFGLSRMRSSPVPQEGVLGGEVRDACGRVIEPTNDCSRAVFIFHASLHVLDNGSLFSSH